jgi:hypothetical protein
MSEKAQTKACGTELHRVVQPWGDKLHEQERQSTANVWSVPIYLPIELLPGWVFVNDTAGTRDAIDVRYARKDLVDNVPTDCG